MASATGLSPNIRLIKPEPDAMPPGEDIVVEDAPEGADVEHLDDQGNVIQIEHDDGSITISWSQPMPVLRLAMARALAWSMAMGRWRASNTTKSFPSPFILRKWRGEASVMGALDGKSPRDC